MYSSQVRGKTGWVARITSRTGVATTVDPKIDLDPPAMVRAIYMIVHEGADVGTAIGAFR